MKELIDRMWRRLLGALARLVQRGARAPVRPALRGGPVQFDGDVCNGRVHVNPAFLPPPDTPGPMCKGHVLQRFREDMQPPQLDEVWAVGDDVDDVGMLRRADRCFAFDPKGALAACVPGIVRVDSFAELSDVALQTPRMQTAA